MCKQLIDCFQPDLMPLLLLRAATLESLCSLFIAMKKVPLFNFSVSWNRVLANTHQTIQAPLCNCTTTACWAAHIIIALCTVCLHRTFPQGRLIPASLQRLLPLALRVSSGTQTQLHPTLFVCCFFKSMSVAMCCWNTAGLETLLICRKIRNWLHVTGRPWSCCGQERQMLLLAHLHESLTYSTCNKRCKMNWNTLCISASAQFDLVLHICFGR